MNSDQRKIVIYGLYALGVLLCAIFWRVGTQYDYSRSVLVYQLSEAFDQSYYQPGALSGIRIRMGILGVVFGAILPVILIAGGAFLQKADAD